MACRLPLLLTCALLAGAAQAAELGEPRVSSHIGQQLVADIELTMLEDAANPVQVRLADPNVYRGANIGMPTVLSTLRMSVMRRDGRQFLHVTSLGKVESEHLHLYLELADGSQRTVRLATLWLAPDPNPAPPPPPVPVPPPVLARVAEPEPKPAPAPVAVKPKPLPAPAKPKPAPAPVKAAAPAPAKPAPAPAGGACVPQARQEIDACVVLGAKNAMLREQLGPLEDKVRVLQVAAGASAASVVQPVKPHKPKRKKAEPPPEAGTPWLLVGGAAAGVLALLAGLAVVMRRRKTGRRPAEPRVGLGTRLKARLGRKASPAATVEPTLEEDARESSTQV
jgi:pilus assembly protein FimV